MRLPAVFLVAAIAAGSAVAAGPALKHSRAGNGTAKASLLTAADLGKGWRATPALGQQAPTFQCRGYRPSEKGIVEIGAATSSSFNSGGVTIVQRTGVYASPAQASTLWKRAVTRGLIDCVALDLASVQSRGIKARNFSGGTIALPKPVPKTMAYRVTATLSAGNRSLKTYFDVIVLASRKTITEIAISTFGNPVPANVEKALAQIVAKRLGSPTA